MATYVDFFSTIKRTMGGYSEPVTYNGTTYPFDPNWQMFTTNYDAILEHYWLDIAQVQLNTGFGYNYVARMEVTNPESFRSAGLRLFKLHGSIDWYRYNLTVDGWSGQLVNGSRYAADSDN